MNISEFRRQLEALGARFEEGSKHTKVYLNGKQTTLPRHPSQEIGEGLRRAILKQLAVKQKGK
jgi:mRNA interferase HicA